MPFTSRKHRCITMPGIQDDVLISFVFRTFDLLEVGAILRLLVFAATYGTNHMGRKCKLSVNFRIILAVWKSTGIFLFSSLMTLRVCFYSCNLISFTWKSIIAKIKKRKYFDEQYICSFFWKFEHDKLHRNYIKIARNQYITILWKFITL